MGDINVEASHATGSGGSGRGSQTGPDGAQGGPVGSTSSPATENQGEGGWYLSPSFYRKGLRQGALVFPGVGIP